MKRRTKNNKRKTNTQKNNIKNNTNKTNYEPTHPHSNRHTDTEKKQKHINMIIKTNTQKNKKY